MDEENLNQNFYCSCQKCHKMFQYKDLLVVSSWNGKWKDYVSPCCRSRWSSVRDNMYVFRKNKTAK